MKQPLPTITQGSKNFRPPPKPVVTLGVFDGIHRGHREIFRKTIERAQAIRGTPVAYTFDPHPVRVFAPEASPPLINTLAQRLELIQSLGIRRIVVEHFTRTFAQQTPQQFFKNILLKRLRPSELLVGYNFTFGVHRSGNAALLEELGRKAGIHVHIVRPYLEGESLVSSTQVRQLLGRGLLEAAAALLDRPYWMEGTVVRGRGIGGTKLGIHTANMKPDNDLILPNGVYLSRTRVGSKSFESLTNIGPNPTFGHHPISIETHVLDLPRNLQGPRNLQHRKLHIEFLKKIREEKTFSSPGELALQIERDIETARRFFSGKSS